MPETLLVFSGDGQSEIRVELISDEAAHGGYRSGLGEKAVRRAQKTFGDTLDSLKHITQQVVDKLREIQDSPDEVVLELGVKINAEADIVLSKVGGETHMNLTLKWTKSKPQAPAPPPAA